jgi:parallel beta-helix repeat protein
MTQTKAVTFAIVAGVMCVLSNSRCRVGSEWASVEVLYSQTGAYEERQPAFGAAEDPEATAGSLWDVCLAGCAFDQVQEAIDAAAPGDRIRVARGTYVEHLMLDKAVILEGGYSGPPNWLRSPADYPTVLDGNETASVVRIHNASPVVDGFVITRGRGTGFINYGGGVYAIGASASPVINGNLIVENTAADGGGLFIDDLSSPYVSNNTILRNHASSNGAGIYIDYRSSPTIVNNAIVDNSLGFGGQGIFTFNLPSPIIRNNTIIWQKVGVRVWSGNIVLDRNNVWSNTVDYLGITPDEHSLSVDPKFQSGIDNFHLRPDSPLIDRGSADDAPSFDFDGDPRPLGAGIDIGPDEFPTASISDLVEAACSNPPPATILGVPFPSTDTVRNNGSGTSGNTKTRIYFDRNGTKSAGSTRLLGARAVPPLAFGVESTGVIEVTVPAGTNPGMYFKVCCADDFRNSPESNEKNNCLTSVLQTEVRAPDLVTTAVADPPATAGPGANFGLASTVRNQGNAAAALFAVRYYLSLDERRGGGDKRLPGSTQINHLEPGDDALAQASLTIPKNTESGEYFVLACADDLKRVAESVESNNCLASAQTVKVLK